MIERATLDVAFDILKAKKAPIIFFDLWEEVSKLQNYTEDEKKRLIYRFYTNLTLDGRFVNLGDNTWDLRKNNTFDKVHIDMNDVYSDLETPIDDEEEKELLEEEDVLAQLVKPEEDEETEKGYVEDIE
ncbi:MAG: DNA-directed RNA polymerase subunit delta [Methanomicrobia archaeon]|nr:DNA-directed RNA polymerase subunit delta [Methanomicrobia archaeon]